MDVVDSIDVHGQMKEFVLLRGTRTVGHCVRADSRLKQLFI